MYVSEPSNCLFRCTFVMRYGSSACLAHSSQQNVLGYHSFQFVADWREIQNMDSKIGWQSLGMQSFSSYFISQTCIILQKMLKTENTIKEKYERHLHQLLKEMLETERSYVADLEQVRLSGKRMNNSILLIFVTTGFEKLSSPNHQKGKKKFKS